MILANSAVFHFGSSLGMGRLKSVQDEGDDRRTGGFARSDGRLIEGFGQFLGGEHDRCFADFLCGRAPEA
jgi:hypothetical protein